MPEPFPDPEAEPDALAEADAIADVDFDEPMASHHAASSLR